MRFNKKLCKTFAEQVSENFFQVFLDPLNRGENFNWKNFQQSMCPKHLERQLWLTIGNNKNWKKYLPLVLEYGSIKLIELYNSNNINVDKII